MTDNELYERAVEAAYDAGRNRDGTPPDEWTLGKAIDVVDAYLAIAPQAPVNGAPVAFRWRGIGEWFFGTRAPDGINAQPLYLASPPPPAQADDGKDTLIRELVAALKPFAEEEPEHEAISEANELVAPRWLDATYGQYRAARAALAKAKAKAAGYEP